MFNFIGSILVKTGAVIGGIFISIGAFFGGTPPTQEIFPMPVEEMVVATTSKSAIESAKKPTISPNPAPAIVPSTPPVTTPVPVQPKIQSPGVPTTLQISNVEIAVGEKTTAVSWSTSVPARARLTIDGKVYESLNGIGIEHKVEVDVEAGKEYSYYINAKTLDEKNLEDDLYGSFTALTRRTAILGTLEGECRTIVIKEPAGRLSVGTKVTVRGIKQSSYTTSYQPYETEITNSRGEVEYCHTASKYQISSEGLYVTLP